jgi:hypothetical protein
MGHDYERELKGLLSGDEKFVDKMTKTGSDDIVLAFCQPTREPFSVVRAAGSLGDGDLVVLRNGFAFLVEVKAANRDTVHFSESSGKLQCNCSRLRHKTPSVNDRPPDPPISSDRFRRPHAP